MVYASDFHFLETALHMYGLNVFVRGVQVRKNSIVMLLVFLSSKFANNNACGVLMLMYTVFVLINVLIRVHIHSSMHVCCTYVLMRACIFCMYACMHMLIC